IISSSSTAVESLRNDLLFRINVVTLTIPPLRDRREDIPQLTRNFIGGRKRSIDPDALQMLTDYRWPGNVRDLRNVIDRAVLMEESNTLTARALPELVSDPIETAVQQR